MKKLLNITALSLVFTFSGIVLTGCEDEGGTFTADEARAELIQAGEEIMYNMGMAMQMPAMESMTFFVGLSGIEVEFKTAPIALFPQRGKPYIPGYGLMGEFIEAVAVSSHAKQMEGGVFQYNFDTGQFDLINSNVNYLEFVYPANYDALVNRQLNASVRIENLEMIGIEVDGYMEILPVSAEVILRIDGQQVMHMSMQMQYNQNALPTEASLVVDMPPYLMNVEYSGSGRNYTANASFKEGTKVLLQVQNMSLVYTHSEDELERANGSIQITPLLFNGSVEVLAMENCNDNIDCMNDNLDVEVRHSVKNMKIGMLEYRMYNDPGFGSYPDLVVVYADGTYDFLSELFDTDF